MLKAKTNPEHFGVVDTAIPKCSDFTLKQAFKSFLSQPETYRKQFLQDRYNYAFDGYSYLGQKDSTNQYDTDLLHSFVLSEFSKVNSFPKEMHPFLDKQWVDLIVKVRSIERDIIKTLNLPGLEEFYNNTIGHMVSCNFYPKINYNQQTQQLRLSKHKDVSLFTVFVFGSKAGFSFQDNNKNKKLKETDNIVVFPGYLLEYLSQGKYNALEHQVDFTEIDKERYSFAFFSIPKPFQNIVFNQQKFSSESYYKDYLSLF